MSWRPSWTPSLMPQSVQPSSPNANSNSFSRLAKAMLVSWCARVSCAVRGGEGGTGVVDALVTDVWPSASASTCACAAAPRTCAWTSAAGCACSCTCGCGCGCGCRSPSSLSSCGVWLVESFSSVSSRCSAVVVLTSSDKRPPRPPCRPNRSDILSPPLVCATMGTTPARGARKATTLFKPSSPSTHPRKFMYPPPLGASTGS
mmetsp:Transcript_27627/g.68898  ORF Transcript_27627/g.68898 Transcript_27627/m.68898 type:complete len:203 (-) Transcript_27627:775-1383(-)